METDRHTHPFHKKIKRSFTMKKLTSLLLITALLLSALALFASCAHKCTFATAWSHDDTNHWHACEDKKCTLTADQAAHTWNDGEITTKATQEAAGVKTFTCTVCSATKTESVAFTGLTEAEWNDLFKPALFDNFTMLMTITGSGSGVSVTSEMKYKFGADKIYLSITSGGQTEEQIMDEDVADMKAESAEEILQMFKYADYTYDAEAKLYRAKGEIEIVFDGSKPTDATLRFENGKPVELKYSYTTQQSGVDVAMNTTVVFSDYGTTVVTETVAQ